MRLWLKQKIMKLGWSFWLFLLFLAYFLYLIPTDLVSYGWSTDFTRIGYLGGNYSAIQFGLLLRIINIFTNLLPFLVIKNFYILASLLGALALGLFYKILSKIEDLIQIGDKRLGFLLKNLSVVWLATSQSFLLQSRFIERYMLVVLGLECIALLIFKMQENKAKFSRDYFLLIIVTVLGISYHWLFLWVSFLMLLNQVKITTKPIGHLLNQIGKFLLIIFGGVVVGYLLTSNTLVDHTFKGAFSIGDAFRRYFQTYLSDGFNNSFKIDSKSVPNTFLALVEGFGGIYGILAGILGLMGIKVLITKLGKKSGWGIIFLLGVFLLPSLWLSNIKMVSEVAELYQLVMVVVWSVYSWVGLMFVADRLWRGLSIIHSKTNTYLFLTVVIGGLIISSLITQVGDLKYLSFEADEMRVVLNQLPDKSLLFCFDDLICADLIYLSEVEKIGNEVMVVPYYYYPDKYALDLSDYRLFEYDQYPYIIHEIMALALADANTRVFSMGLTDEYYRFLGFNLGFVHYLPLGNYGEVLLTTPKDWPKIESLKIQTSGLESNSNLENKFINLLIHNRLLNSRTYFLSGRYVEGYEEMNTSSRVANKLSREDFASFLIQRNFAEQQVKNPLQVDSNKNDSIEKIFEEIPRYIEGGYHGRAADLVRGAIMLSPYDKEVRLKASEIYEQIGLEKLAEFEMSIYNQLKFLKN